MNFKEDSVAVILLVDRWWLLTLTSVASEPWHGPTALLADVYPVTVGMLASPGLVVVTHFHALKGTFLRLDRCLFCCQRDCGCEKGTVDNSVIGGATSVTGFTRFDSCCIENYHKQTCVYTMEIKPGMHWAFRQF